VAAGGAIVDGLECNLPTHVIKSRLGKLKTRMCKLKNFLALDSISPKCLPTLAWNRAGAPAWDDLLNKFPWMSTDGKDTKWRRNIAENFNRLSRVHERYRRQTDGRATAYRKRSLKRRQGRAIANINRNFVAFHILKCLNMYDQKQ